MAIIINKKVWVLAERLYIYKHTKEDFIKFLQRFDLNYTNDNYNTFDSTKGLYTFMSTEDYAIAEFMELVPIYKYIPILQEIIFDERIQQTIHDNWNYYGEFVKKWYPDLLDLINLAGITVDTASKQLKYTEPTLLTEASQNFIQDGFGDYFLDHICREINQCYKNGLYLSVMFLSRKLLETIIIRLFEVVFPKMVNKIYSAENHLLWYDTSNNRYHNFEILLDNLHINSKEFHEDEKMINDMLLLVRPFKNETNKCIHLDYKIPDEKYITGWRIPVIIAYAHRLFRKNCNP